MIDLNLWSVSALLLTLGILVTVHEYGHFWVARRLGVRVLRFSVGFGHALISRRAGRDGTEFVLAAIPLGGYVQMLDEREGEVPANERHRSFNAQPVLGRMAIVAAGPLANFLFAILVYTVMFMIGVEATRPLLGDPLPQTPAAEAGLIQGELVLSIDGEAVRTLDQLALQLVDRAMVQTTAQVETRDALGQVRQHTLDLTALREAEDQSNPLAALGLRLMPVPAMIGQVLPDGPAGQAGVQQGDRVLFIDSRPVDTWQSLVDTVRQRPDSEMILTVERDGMRLELPLRTEVVEQQGERIGRIGVGAMLDPTFEHTLRITERHALHVAVWMGVERCIEMSAFTLRILVRMFTGHASLDNLSGPLTIAHFAGQAASIGFMSFLSLLALISISLAVLNLLPIPVLDGGHLLYYFVELVRGRPVPDSVQVAGQRFGLAILLALMSLAIFNDFSRLLG